MCVLAVSGALADLAKNLGVHVCLEKFTCLESTARLAVQLEYAMTYPPEDRPQGSLQERWSNLPGDRARVGGSTRTADAASCSPSKKQNYGFVFHGLPAQVLCPLSRGDVRVSSTSMP